MKIDQFLGLNNVLQPQTMKPGELVEAVNCDVGLAGELSLRAGYAETSADPYRNLWDGPGFTLATNPDGDLINLDTAVVLYESLGNTRVRYCNLPDGRVAFTNGLITGLTDGATRTAWGMPIPESLGDAADVAGQLFPGSYRYSITYRRTVDGREGPPLHSEPVAIANGGIDLVGLPELAGHSINVYLTSHNGSQPYLAGNTAGSTFSFAGPNHDLQQRCLTDGLNPAPVGSQLTWWKTRAVVAVGNVLYASLPHLVELFDMRRDVKQIAQHDDTAIHLLHGVEGGIFVGTDKALYFLGGPTFDQLAISARIQGAAVKGSAVTVSGEHIGDGSVKGECMLAIVAGSIVAGMPDGSVRDLTRNRYHTDATEVCATFRTVDDVPQYIAIPQ